MMRITMTKAPLSMSRTCRSVAVAMTLSSAFLFSGPSACSGARTPRAAPPATLPAVTLPEAPPAPGTGRVVLDVVDGRSDVQIKLSPSLTPSGTAAAGDFTYGTWQHLCSTPCVVDLPPGQHDISIRVREGRRRGDTDVLVVEPDEVTAYRRAITIREGSFIKSYAGYTLLSIGVPFLLTGLLLLPIDDVDPTTALIVIGLGATGTAGGGYLLYDGIPHHYRGATTNWRLAGPGDLR
jgi:hypothetical protein